MPKVVDIFRDGGDAYLSEFEPHMLPSHRRALSDILACRTPAMGGHVPVCADCGTPQPHVYHSCRNRACPQCHVQRTQKWLDARARDLLPVPYYHIIMTVSPDVRVVARQHQEVVLDAIMCAAAASLHTLALDPRFGGGRIGSLMVLHTWTRALMWHPHVHILIPAVVMRPDGTWVVHPGRALVPTQPLMKMFRGKLNDLLQRRLPGVTLPPAAWSTAWVGKSRRCDEGPEKVLQYLARYVFRGPMSDRRILQAENGRVVIGYRDSETQKPGTVTLSTTEFMRRYLQHTLPRGFHKVRYHGLWAPANRRILYSLQLQMAPGMLEAADRMARNAPPPPPVPTCVHCGSTRLQPRHLWLRGQKPPAQARGPPLTPP